jgi:hypothetical protein
MENSNKKKKVKIMKKKKNQWVLDVLSTKKQNNISFKNALLLASTNRKKTIS